MSEYLMALNQENNLHCSDHNSESVVNNDHILISIILKMGKR